MTSEDEATQNLSKCIELANWKISNNGSVGDLCAQVERALGLGNAEVTVEPQGGL